MNPIQDTAENRPPFKVRGNATIKHLNVRKEGPEEEKILAVDVKMEIKNVDRRLCAYFDDALEAFLWRGNTDALIARNAWLGPVQYGHEITGATVEIDGRSFVGCEVKKFALVPQDGGVMTLTLAVSVYPSSPEVSDLAKLVQDEALVAIEGPPDLFAVEPAPGDKQPSRVIATLNAPASFDGADDPMLGEARELVLSTRRASISLVQRHLKIGYNRAARLVEALETEGLVSPMNASGARTVIGGAA